MCSDSVVPSWHELRVRPQIAADPSPREPAIATVNLVTADAIHGAATRRALLRTGATHHQLARAVSSGRIQRPRRGVYVKQEAAGLQAIAVALLVGGVGSHASARAVLRIDGPSDEDVYRTVSRNWNGLRVKGEHIHRADLAPEEVVEVGGLSVTSPLRTVLDEARALPLEWAVAVADSALHQGLIDKAELVAAAAKVRGPGSSRVRLAAAMADDRAESVLESLARVALLLAGLDPDVQHRIGRFRVDLLIGNVVIELDGFAFHSNREDYRRDRRRTNALTTMGYRVLRFSWEDVVGDPGYVVAKVREALALV